MVHLEARKLGLRGLNKDELPDAIKVLREHWLALVPLAILIYLIVTGRTPDFAAVYSIIACVVVGVIKKKNRLTLPGLWDAMAMGARGTIAVGAAAACVGIIVGVVTLTGVGFRLGFMVVQTANEMGGFLSSIWPLSYFGVEGWALFLALALIAIACILMGAGIPTTATYIILVSVAAPGLAALHVQDIVAHFFVFYYGVLADITPPVALAAYAAAGIAGSNPFRTGNAAFRLGIAKALVPFVFVYSPSLLIVAHGFTVQAFVITLIGAIAGIGLMGTAFSGFMLARLNTFERIWAGLVSLLFVAPGLVSMGVGAVLIAPLVFTQWNKRRLVPVAS